MDLGWVANFARGIKEFLSERSHHKEAGRLRFCTLGFLLLEPFDTGFCMRENITACQSSHLYAPD